MKLPTIVIRRSAFLFALALPIMWGLSAQDAQAQFILKWLSVGEMHKYYTEAGSHNEDYQGHNIHWPGIRREHGNVRGYALWIGAKDFTDENGTNWQAKIAHVGPRITGLGEVFPEDFTMISAFDPPVTKVDGFETFNRPVVNDEVDASLKFDRTIYSRTSNVLGITQERWASQFSQEYHDNYHILEFVFTNTGNVDNDADIELPDQTLNDVFFYYQNRYAPNRSAGWEQNNAQGWGKWTMNDVVGDGHETYDVDFRAQWSWLGHVPGKANYTTIGGPLWSDNLWLVASGDSTGRLGAAHMLGRLIIHADEAADNEADDPSQPSTMNYVWTGDERTHLNEHVDLNKMLFEYELIEEGRVYPHHADLIEPEGNFALPVGDPTLGRGGDGFAFGEGFGPYTMGPGEDVRIIIAEAIAGLSDEASVVVGQTYKRAAANETLKIDFDANGDGVIGEGESLTKNEWALSTKDSLFQTFERALAAYENGWTIPQPPRPPATFDVVSRTDEVALSWSAYSGETPDSWELWRAEKRFDGLPIDPTPGTDSDPTTWPTVYQLVQEFPASTTSYSDTDVIRGVDYFYYLQAVGPVNTDPSGNTPIGVPLKSNRYWAQTYDPARLKRPPGGTLEAARIVPNPYNLNADESLLFSNKNLLFFFDIPGNSTIKIYSELGELIRTLEHTDGSGDESWDLQTEALQIVASGVFIAHIMDNDTGQSISKKFVVVR